MQAAVNASAELKAVPSNLDPPLAGTAAEYKAVFQNGCLRNLFEAGQPECATGDTASTTTVALLGDSHATMWAPAFQHIAMRRHWRLETLGKGACTPMGLPIADTIRRAVSDALCQQWRAQILARLGRCCFSR
ncbi:SGNH hydrolase domain-containing protein [Mycobacterium servetii]|uniref:SGNH hydrolase domain-containing protein n=1 Tax=Mycobacterium servetii TaxID=3237418 RepID=A0ABV4C264_9MYCO